MQQIQVDRLAAKELERLKVAAWPVWEKEPSRFPWSYEETERCLILEGEATVESGDGARVRIQAGDFVTFPKGLSCTWEVTQSIRKHYSFGD